MYSELMRPYWLMSPTSSVTAVTLDKSEPFSSRNAITENFQRFKSISLNWQSKSLNILQFYFYFLKLASCEVLPFSFSKTSFVASFGSVLMEIKSWT
jgi:hypothetical protein